MKQLSILITLLVITSLALGGEVYEGLKVKGNYKELRILVESIQDNEAGLTKESVLRKTKLKLLANGIKPTENRSTPHYLYVNINVMEDGTVYRIDVELKKYAVSYGVDASITGPVFKPYQGPYGSIGSSGRDDTFITNHLEAILDMFLLDYLESNME